MSKVKHIIDGWSNYFQGSDPATLEEANRRAEICAKCPLMKKGLHLAILPDMKIKKIQGYYCSKKMGGCGCPISTIVRSKDYECPKGKW